MMEFLLQYGIFLAKFLTIIVGILILITGILSIAMRSRGQTGTPQLTVRNLNEKYTEMTEAINSEILEKKALKQYLKTKKHEAKAAAKADKPSKRIFVLNFQGDLKASAVEHFREEITAVLGVATPSDEVFVTVESGGGMIQTYGLAASQLARIRARNIPLTISVDKIAASGGYLMACVANRILAAPFSILGSVGVIAQLPNFHRFLKQHRIDFEQVSAGEFKRTLSLFGENTTKGRKKFQEELDEAHALFKNFIQTYRPTVDIAKVATGEYWLGTHALAMGLVDELVTSDDYLLSANANSYKLYAISYQCRQSFKDKLSAMMQTAIGFIRGQLSF
jgi:serine protease SohB